MGYPRLGRPYRTISPRPRWYPPRTTGKPIVTAVAATSVLYTSAILNAIVDPNGSDTEGRFAWSTTEFGLFIEPKFTPFVEFDVEESEVPVSFELEGLPEGQKIRFQFLATNTAGSTNGAVLNFTTQKHEGVIKNIIPRASYPPDNIGIKIKTPSGRPSRWGDDEANSDNVIGGLTISTEIPGGFKNLGGRLARDPQRQWPELQPYSEIEAYLGSGKRVFEGYLDKAPDVSGEQASISPAALGWQAALEDNQSVRVGFIHSNANDWGDPSAQRHINLLAAGYTRSGTAEVGFKDSGSTLAGLLHKFDEVGTKMRIVESWFDSQGIKIGKLLYSTEDNFETEANYNSIAGISTDDLTTSYDQKNHKQLAAVAQTLLATAARYYAFFLSAYVAVPADTTVALYRIWQRPTVVGDHGLPIQGAFPDVGLLARDMLVYLINNFSDVISTDETLVDNDGFIIPHAWYSDLQPLPEIAKDIMKYGWYDWFIYNKKKFEYRKPGTYGKVWKASVSQSNLNEVGIDSSRSWDRITVQWNDTSGRTRTAGYIGSEADVETSELQTVDTSNPAVAAGRPRRYLLVFNGDITEATAIELGKRFLEEAELINRSGSATLVGYVMDENGYFHPVSEVQAGDWIEFTDGHDRSPRKIVNTNYTHEKRTNEIDLDAPASGMDALLERLNAVLIPLGVTI